MIFLIFKKKSLDEIVESKNINGLKELIIEISKKRSIISKDFIFFTRFFKARNYIIVDSKEMIEEYFEWFTKNKIDSII